MRDLCEATGLERQAIHFYIQQGLLPPGEKTGRNMAWYAEEHRERLLLIKKLQRERFLPLKAIKALLDGEGESFTPEQKSFLDRVRAKMAPPPQPPERIPEAQVLALPEVTLTDLDEAIELGLLAFVQDDSGQRSYSQSDYWKLELFSKMRALGFSREQGFSVKDIAFYQETIDRLFESEIQLLSSRLSDNSAEDVAALIEKALPLVQTFLHRYHEERIRQFFQPL